MYNKEFYSGKRQKIQEKFNNARQKWINLCELCGKEYADFVQTAQELQVEVKQLDAEEKKSQEASKEAPKETPKKK